jgi:hypothetical protein
MEAAWVSIAIGVAGALLLLIRYRKGGQETVVDLVEEIVVTARRVGASLTALGDWTNKIPAHLAGLFAPSDIGNSTRFLGSFFYETSDA